MPRAGSVLVGTALLVLVVVLPASGVTTSPTPVGPHVRPDGHVSLAWFYGGSSADYRSQIEQMVGLTTISPTWWYLDETEPGQVDLGTDDELVAWAQARGLAVWPLFGNHIDPDLTDLVLRDPVLRGQLVDGIAAEVRRSGVDGVNVDFENLHDDTRFLLTDLVAELKAALPDRIISVDVTAMTDTWVLDNWSTAFDREGLGDAADYVMLMAYDQHNSLRRDGPVAGLQWVSESTEFLMRSVSVEKIVLGLPLYSRDWATDAAARDGVDLDATLGMAAMAHRVAERSEATVYDPVAGQDLHSYTDDGGRPHRIWLEDIASLQRKTDLVAAHGLAGVAAWRAGFEQPEVWGALDTQMAAMAAPGSRQVPAPSEGAAEVQTDPTAPPSDEPDAPAQGAAADVPDVAAVPDVADVAVTAGVARPGIGASGVMILTAGGLLMFVGGLHLAHRLAGRRRMR